MLSRDVFFSSETTSDQLVFNNYPLWLPSEHVGNFISGRIGTLIGRKYLDTILVWK